MSERSINSCFQSINHEIVKSPLQNKIQPFDSVQSKLNMNRNNTFSKETLDKVRLAKKYIEDRYHSIIDQDKRVRKCMKNILSSAQGLSNLKQITEKSIKQKSIEMRLLRQKKSLEDYKLYALIGRGAFGEVRLAEEKHTGQVVAIKRLKKSRIAEKKQIFCAYIEKELMGNSQSQYIVKLINAFQDEEYLYIVMQYAPGGDLLHLLIEQDILTEEATKFYIAEMILAVEEIHKMGYIHRDIKPDNILLDKNGHIKISDFGLSKYVNPGRTHGRFSKLKKFTQFQGRQEKIFSKVGTPDYISPQVLTENVYDHAIDLWGIGVIMFECLYGFPPFTDDDSTQVCCHVVNWIDYLEFPQDISISTSGRMLILGLINERSKRLTIAEIKKHPFFSGFDWNNAHKMTPPFPPSLSDKLDVKNFDQFDVEEPWTKFEKELFEQLNETKRVPTSVSFETSFSEVKNEEEKKRSLMNHYSFACFDSLPKRINPLTAELERIERNSYSHKPLKKSKQKKKNTTKRLKTEDSKESERQKSKLMKIYCKNKQNHSVEKKFKGEKTLKKIGRNDLIQKKRQVSRKKQFLGL